MCKLHREYIVSVTIAVEVIVLCNKPIIEYVSHVFFYIFHFHIGYTIRYVLYS